MDEPGGMPYEQIAASEPCREKFRDWLKAKYGSEEALKKAWPGALAANESLASRNIVPQ